MEKRCVYTTLFGNYELINEQEVAKESEIDFICFTDNPDLQSETWKIIYTEPIFPLDPARSSRFVKICPHRCLPDYDSSLYIDNSVELLAKPEIIFNDLFSQGFDFALMKHSFRETVLDEFNEVNLLQLEFIDRIIEQLNDYKTISPQILGQKPFWGGFLLRRHNVPIIIKAMEDWFFQVLRYSRRDQLSLNYIVDKYNINIKAYNIDNKISIYHKWPTSDRLKSNIVPGNLKQKYKNDFLDLSKDTLEINQHQQLLENGLKTFDQFIQLLNAQLDERDQSIQSLNTQLAERDQSIQSLNTQLAERDQSIQYLNIQLTAYNQVIQSLNNQLTEQKKTIQTLNFENVMYATSHSWIITRPFRRIAQLLKRRKNAK